LKDNNSYILFICGGKWQMPWLLYLKEKGHRIILVDPYETSVCVPLADVHIALDARDVNGIYNFIVSNNYKIDFVTSEQTDVSTQTVSNLSQMLGTRGNNPKATELFSNKLLNREFVKTKFGAHYPHFIRAKSAQDIKVFFSQEGESDIIIKPADAQSSRGIHRITVNNVSELDELVQDAFSQTKENYIVAEKFIHGAEFTVEGIFTGLEHHTLAISRKKHFRTGIASELRYPAELPEKLHNALIKFHDQLIKESGLGFGITHTEYLIDEENGEFYLVEMACRGGGSLIPSDIVPWVSGVPVYGVFYNLITGKKTEIVPFTQARHAILYFFEFQAGVVEQIDGVELASAFPGVQVLDLEFKLGDTIKPAGDDRGRQGYCIIYSESAKQLNETLQNVLNVIKVKTSNFILAL